MKLLRTTLIIVVPLAVLLYGFATCAGGSTKKQRALTTRTLGDFKQVYFVANMILSDRSAENVDKPVALSEVWPQLGKDMQERLLKTRFSYFPLEKKGANSVPFIIVELEGNMMTIFSDGAGGMSTNQKNKSE